MLSSLDLMARAALSAFDLVDTVTFKVISADG